MPDHIDPSDPAAEAAIESAALRPEIELALSALPADFRNAVVLSDLEGLSLPQVAEVLEIPIGTVKSRVFRGRRLLALQLGNQNTS
jgi:RNA polymerase sigma-70 factor (ECF subfamily)